MQAIEEKDNKNKIYVGSTELNWKIPIVKSRSQLQ